MPILCIWSCDYLLCGDVETNPGPGTVKSLSYLGAKLWNKLPTGHRITPSKISFKSLFTEPGRTQTDIDTSEIIENKIENHLFS